MYCTVSYCTVRILLCYSTSSSIAYRTPYNVLHMYSESNAAILKMSHQVCCRLWYYDVLYCFDVLSQTRQDVTRSYCTAPSIFSTVLWYITFWRVQHLWILLYCARQLYYLDSCTGTTKIRAESYKRSRCFVFQMSFLLTYNPYQCLPVPPSSWDVFGKISHFSLV